MKKPLKFGIYPFSCGGEGVREWRMERQRFRAYRRAVVGVDGGRHCCRHFMLYRAWLGIGGWAILHHVEIWCKSGFRGDFVLCCRAVSGDRRLDGAHSNDCTPFDRNWTPCQITN